VLIDFDGNDSLKDLASECGDGLKYFSGRVKEQLGLSAVLIRPDGIVAWASDGGTDRGELKKAAGRWFVFGSGIGN
jgi:hypothetical protein